jgi:hypothetical protein
MKNKLSHVLSFYQLLKAIKNDDETFLLCSSDPYAQSPMQEYNDQHSDPTLGTRDWQIVDGIAASFAEKAKATDVLVPIPGNNELALLDKALTQLCTRCNIVKKS